MCWEMRIVPRISEDDVAVQVSEMRFINRVSAGFARLSPLSRI